MRKVGATTSGSVIVEMDLAQFEALKQFMDPKPAPAEKMEKQEVKAMAVKRKLDNIRNCVRKLKPESRESLVLLIKNAHSFSGAYAEKELDHLIEILAREKHFEIKEDGRLEYGHHKNESSDPRRIDFEASKTPVIAGLSD
ncbi:hypothetical protein G0Q06_10920 [Puniceicoccales bacterium CK1056]|uniref:Uncharacterized protein n=1 Tax=Oceanipulchritudo coccoides TaxID=2706888 RepID=A0A6B2M586_9BACT|nr:hypothetical protein [Oceanipulchritudo coccoides]NDV62965.1 hypothetical protein [Oceanipulchritudo coccoides]